MAIFFLRCVIKKLISLAIVPEISARDLLIETSPQYILPISTEHISWFQVSANDIQAVFEIFVRSSSETYSKLCGSFPNNLSKVACGTRKTSMVEVVLTNLYIPVTDDAEYNLALVYFRSPSIESLGTMAPEIAQLEFEL